ncbi:MAG: hypothetical protein WDN75_03515 [Bacteroidota bacterium]
MKTSVISSSQFRIAVAVSISVMMITFLVQLSSCHKCCAPAFNPREAVKAKLMANNWKMQRVLVDDVDKTNTYAGLTIQFAPASFTTTNGKAVWPASGTWSFVSEDGRTIRRDDGIIVEVEITDIALKLTLTWSTTTLSGGKLQSVKGINVFSFVK